MKTILLIIFLILTILVLAVIIPLTITKQTKKLKQVFVLSRHGVRSQLGFPKIYSLISPKPWPRLTEKRLILTSRGRTLESNMGEYFSQWFQQEKFLTKCPDDTSIYIYTNNLNRTKDTAFAFLKTAFKNCDIPISFYSGIEKDNFFDPIVRNTTTERKNEVISEIYKILDNPKLKDAFTMLDDILDIKNSDVCKLKMMCSLNEVIHSHNIFYKVGFQLDVAGPISVAQIAVDRFLTAYYNGDLLENIAWGFIDSHEKWELLTEVIRLKGNILYGTIAEDIAEPLLEYMSTVFNYNDDMPKLIMFYAHDSNLEALVNVMGFSKTKGFPNQLENFPLGGKLVIQRWTDGKKDYLKIEYVYQSWSQIRNATTLSMDNPPQKVLMDLPWCKIDENGFCPWEEFLSSLHLINPI